MNEAPLAEMCKMLDAIKIDLKGYSEDFYRYRMRGGTAARPQKHQTDSEKPCPS